MRCAHILRYKIDTQRLFSWPTIDYPTCHLHVYLPRIHTCLKAHVKENKGLCVHRGNTNDSWVIPLVYHSKAFHN